MASPMPMMSQPVDDTIQLERNAGLIMGTNSSSIVSKRSVERLYLPEPHFYRYFVRKPQRRSPTINRGYWLRMRAVDWTVRRFLEKPSIEPKIIINLGCGYDPLPFQWLATEKDLCSQTKFIDIDYEELLITKREIIRTTPKMSNLLTSLDGHAIEKSILLDSVEYAAIGCDLRNIPRLQRLLKTICETEKYTILLVAEVALTYMHTDKADAIIQWASRLSPNTTFCLLEQGSPDRPDHPFTATMVKHFQKIGTPLHSLFEYPGMHSNIIRFQRAGYTHCDVQNLWELWSDPAFLSPSQRLALDHVEPFDEWEEFALFASHYLLVVAHNRSGPNEEPERSRSRRDSIASIASDISARTVSPFNSHTQWFAMKYREDSSDDTKRHHASAYQLPDQDAIAMHGGIGPKARLSSTVVTRDKFNHESTPIVPSPELSARCCHTITTLSNGQNIMIGGRGSPTQPRKDCWIQTGQLWTRIEDLPEPRYRHRTVPVTLPDGAFGAIVFGGKTNASRVTTETLLWHPGSGWEVLRLLHQSPVPRFGASFVYLGFNHGLLFGGMRQDGVICQGLWRWRLIIRNNKVAGISFRTSNALDATIGAYPWFARLGASCGLVRDELLIIGGIAKSGCIPKLYEILSVLGSFSAFNEHEKEMQLRLTCVEPLTAPGCPRSFFIGHSTHRTKTGTLVFMGGGATCFSFGNYYNSGIWIMYEREAGLHVDWTVVKSQSSRATAENNGQGTWKCATKGLLRDVESANINDVQAFVSLIQKSRPVVMRNLQLGPCLTTWAPAALRSKVPRDKVVVIHNAPSPSMNFQRKDFAYKSMTFSSFISALISPSSHIYLRALSNKNPTTSPANFEEDWPELAQDVQIPSHLNAVLQGAKHSSCLRMANNITMWLHYDVMANVLFQIHGVKKLILFPPKDIKYLSFPPGSTTSEIDVFRHTSANQSKSKPKPQDQPNEDVNSRLEQPKPTAHTTDQVSTPEKPSTTEDEVEILVPKGTTPEIVILKPGDALFIPPLWAHAGISLRRESEIGNSGPSDHKPTRHSSSNSPKTPNTTDPFSLSPPLSPTISTIPLRQTREPQQELTSSSQTAATASEPETNDGGATATATMTSSASTSATIQDADQAQHEQEKKTPHDQNKYTNIALNIFFRSLPRQTYAAGKDVYGNRDLAAYEDSRRDIERIVKRFNVQHSLGVNSAGDGTGDGAELLDGITSSIPTDVVKAYLDRLADELKRKADEL